MAQGLGKLSYRSPGWDGAAHEKKYTTEELDCFQY
jgi:hypothetical protein